MEKDKNLWFKRANISGEEHVKWLLDLLRPLLIDHFVHGYKHGVEESGKGTIIWKNLSD